MPTVLVEHSDVLSNYQGSSVNAVGGDLGHMSTIASRSHLTEFIGVVATRTVCPDHLLEMLFAEVGHLRGLPSNQPVDDTPLAQSIGRRILRVILTAVILVSLEKTEADGNEKKVRHGSLTGNGGRVV